MSENYLKCNIIQLFNSIFINLYTTTYGRTKGILRNIQLNTPEIVSWE